MTYFWHKSSLDPVWRARFHNHIAPVFRAITGVELGVGPQYTYNDRIFEVYSHDIITAELEQIDQTDEAAAVNWGFSTRIPDGAEVIVGEGL